MKTQDDVIVYDRCLFAVPVRGRVADIATKDGAFQIEFYDDNPGGPNVTRYNGRYFHAQQCRRPDGSTFDCAGEFTITVEQREEAVRGYKEKIETLQRNVKLMQERGDPLEDYQGRKIRQIRALFPGDSAPFLDTEIARAYSQYCELHHGAGWTRTDIELFGKWAFDGAIHALVDK